MSPQAADVRSGMTHERAIDLDALSDAVTTWCEALGHPLPSIVYRVIVRGEPGSGVSTLVRALRGTRSRPAHCSVEFVEAGDADPGVAADAILHVVKFPDLVAGQAHFGQGDPLQIFVLVNHADQMPHVILKSLGRKPEFIKMYDRLVNAMRPAGLSQTRLHFTCGLIAAAGSGADASDLSGSRARLDALACAVDEDFQDSMGPFHGFPRRHLSELFKDGGMDALRQQLLGYLCCDVRLTRLHETIAQLAIKVDGAGTPAVMAARARVRQILPQE